VGRERVSWGAEAPSRALLLQARGREGGLPLEDAPAMQPGRRPSPVEVASEGGGARWAAGAAGRHLRARGNATRALGWAHAARSQRRRLKQVSWVRAPGPPRQLPNNCQKLRGPTDRERDVVLGADVQDLVPVLVRKVLPGVGVWRSRGWAGELDWGGRPHRNAAALLKLRQTAARRPRPNRRLPRASGHPPPLAPSAHLWSSRQSFAWIEPPRDTMPVMRLAVSGMWRSSTPAWMVQ
jgi:hypothetical protein